MPGINAQTGRLFTEAEVESGLELCQSIEDRVLTPLGLRRHRPNYGSLATDFSRSTDEVIPSIERALAGQEQITEVSFRVADASLRVAVNGRVDVAIAA